jgi:4-aminobutyrate aminotransferase/(S)-3-amino-2-methylpropionate transaminase
VRGNVIRFLAPLTTSHELVNEGMDMLAEALRECVLQASRVR